MKFCPACGSIMQRNTTEGQMVFKCQCQYILEADPTDTLVYEVSLRAAETSRKFGTFTVGAPFDKAAYIVSHDCPKCGLDYLTEVRVGPNARVMYLCTPPCDWTGTDADLKKT